MNLDSVRELKQTLAARVLPDMENTLTARTAMSRAAMPVARAASEPPPSLALGVAPAPSVKGFRLAVRLQKRAFQESREVDLLTKQAKGEVDVRYVGRISKRAVPRQRQRPSRLLSFPALPAPHEPAKLSGTTPRYLDCGSPP